MEIKSNHTSSQSPANIHRSGFAPLMLRSGIGMALGFGAMAAWNLTRPAPTITPAIPATVAPKATKAAPTAPLLNPLDFKGRADAFSKSGQAHFDYSLARDWLAKDPDEATGWLRTLPATFEIARSLESLATEYLPTNLPLARKVIEAMPRSAKRGRLELEFLVKLADTDSDAVIAYARQHLTGATQVEALQIAARAKLQTDPRAAWDFVRDIGLRDLTAFSPRSYQSSYPDNHSGSASVGRSPLSDIIKVASDLYPQEVTEVLVKSGSVLFENASEPDFNKFDRANAIFLKQALMKWIATEPQKVTEWFTKQPENATKPWISLLIAHQLIFIDPTQAQAFTTAQPAGAARDAAFYGIAQNIAQAPHLLPFLQDQEKRDLFRSAIYILAEANPSHAALQFTKLSQKYQTGSHARPIVTALSKTQPQAMIAFWESLPPEAKLHMDLQYPAKHYAELDTEAASTWVNSLPHSEAKNTAIEGLAGFLADRGVEPDYPAAVTWAVKISEPKDVDDCLRSIAITWKRRDPNAAANIRQGNFAEPIKQTLLKHVSDAR